MNADGSNQRQLTTNAVLDLAPEWSPDGERIALVRFGPPDFNADVWVISADGTGADLRLTDSPAFDFSPTWSPNGRWIVFDSDRAGNNALYRIRSNGSGQIRRLTPLALNAGLASWSAEDDEIAFVDNICPTCAESDIFVLELDDNEIEQVTDTPQNELFPDWSPDGEMLVYERGEIVDDELLPPDVFVIDAEGGRPTNLTNSPGIFDIWPSWSPEVADDD